jgi:hypothetical protein
MDDVITYTRAQYTCSSTNSLSKHSKPGVSTGGDGWSHNVRWQYYVGLLLILVTWQIGGLIAHRSDSQLHVC